MLNKKVNDICLKHFSQPYKQISRLDGLTNQVFLVRVSGQDWVIKILNKDEDSNIFVYKKKEVHQILKNTHIHKQLWFHQHPDYEILHYIRSIKLNKIQFRKQSNLILIMKRVAEFHSLYETQQTDRNSITHLWNNKKDVIKTKLYSNYEGEQLKKIMRIFDEYDEFIVS